MATTLQTIVDIARRHLNAPAATETFWTDAELVALTNRGIRDLWRAINDNFQDYFLTVDASNVSLAANGTSLTGVPAGVSIIRGIEARTLTSYPSLTFRPKAYDHADFQTARAQSALDPSQGGTIWWHASGAGGPVAAPTIRVAPTVSATVLLTLIYVPVLADLVIADTNPIPGESDNALVAWTVAYGRAKEREDRSPDPAWINVYGTEKQNILVGLTPRQTEEEETAEAFFEQYWQ
jgi:hypothetical protein